MNGMDWARVTEVFEQSLELPSGAERAAWLRTTLADAPELRNEVESLLAAHEGAGEFLETPALHAAAAVAPRRMGPWEATAEIGRGGLGQVFRGRRADGQYDQDVAIKLLRPGRDSVTVLRQFEGERRILAQLNHPHIARLLDAGTVDDQPYIVMELVDGEPIDAFARHQGLDRAARLRLLAKVCHAVEYAHQRLVVHRDLKPANIFVTAAGEPKLLDFGIASILSGGQAEAGPFLTPGYASPEQLRGEPLSTTADVYSLGVVLYELLAGRQPYPVNTTTTPEGLEAAIRTQPVEPPAPDAESLNSIVMKALQQEPARRYASPGQMADDIDRYLDGYPVLAHPASLRYLGACFIRRNRWGVAASGFALAALVAGLAGTLWQWRVAQAGRVEAELRFQQVRKLARSVLHEFDDSLRDIPGTTAARALMLQRAVEYLDGLWASHPADPELRRELGEAYLRAARIAGRGGQPNLGRKEDAQRYWARAREILEASPAGDVASQRILANVYGDLGGVENATKAVAIYEKNAASSPGDPALQRELADGYAMLARGHIRAEDYPSALLWHTRELEIRRAQWSGNPSDRGLGHSFALASKRIGALYIKLDRLTEAMAAYRAALDVEEKWRQSQPASAEARMAVSYSRSDIGFILKRQGGFAEALVEHQQAMALREEAVAADPSDARAAVALQTSCYRIAMVLRELGRLEEARRFIGRAIAMARSSGRLEEMHEYVKAEGEIAAAMRSGRAAR